MEAPTNTYPDSSAGPGAPVTPPPMMAPQKRGLSRKALISIGAIVVVVLALIAALLHPGIRAWLASLTGVSVDERSAMLVGASEDGARMFYELSNNAIVPVEVPVGLSVVTKRSGVTAGLKGSDLVTLSGNDAQTVFADPEFKETVTVSPDGAWIAFSSMTPGATDGGVGRWYVKQVNLATKEVQIIGMGYAPQYVLRDGKTYLLYTAPEGIGLADLAAGTTEITPVTIGDSEDYAVLVSEDGKYLAIRDALVNQYFVYEIAGVKNGKLSFSVVRGLPTEIVSVAFRGSALYAVSQTDAGQELLVYATADAAEPSARHALPTSPVAYELLP